MRLRNIISKISNKLSFGSKSADFPVFKDPASLPDSEYLEPLSDAAGLNVFYVDVSLGNDSNTGSTSAPWKSIKAAVAKVQPGSVIYVKDGDYGSEGTISIANKKASKVKPIHIVSLSPGGARVGGFKIASSDWIEVSGFTIVGNRVLPAKWQDMPEIVVNDPSITIDYDEDWSTRQLKVNQKYATFISMRNWTKNWTSGIEIAASKHITIANNEISLFTSGIGMAKNADLVLITNNIIHHTYSGIWGYEGGSTSFTNAYIRKNHIFQAFEAGVSLSFGAAKNRVEENIVEYSGGNLIATFKAGNDNLIQNNIIRFGGYYTEVHEYLGRSAISVHSAGTGSQVIGNYIEYMYDVTQRDGNGVAADYNGNGVFVANNVIYRVVGRGITAIKSGKIVAVHNTIIEPGYQSKDPKDGVGFSATFNTDIQNVFANNIVYAPTTGGMYLNGNIQKQTYLDHNLFFLAGKPIAATSFTQGGIYKDLTAFQNAGYGTNTIVSDPLFVDLSAGDYRLKPDSLAKGAGTSKYTLPYDKNGNPRSQSNPSLGAYE